MSKFQIPPQYLQGFDLLANLKTEKVRSISMKLNTFPVGSGAKSFEEIIGSDVENSEITLLSRTIFSLGTLLVSANDSIAEIASELTVSFNETKKEKLTDDQAKNLTNNLVLLLNNCGNLKNTFKAYGLLSENNKIYRQSRIVTDIRLIFNDDISIQNRNAVIIHQLKIEYRHDNVNKDFYLSLDSNDLTKLKEDIDRAIEKEKLIRDNYKSTISFINIKD